MRFCHLPNLRAAVIPAALLALLALPGCTAGGAVSGSGGVTAERGAIRPFVKVGGTTRGSVGPGAEQADAECADGSCATK